MTAAPGDRTIMASRFKAECLAILDQVEEMKISVTITKHGRPVARVVPLQDAGTARSTMGSVRLIAEEDAAYYSSGEHWDADPRAGMTPLLDTHALVWWQAGGDRLSKVARRAIEDAETLLVSPLTFWEVATLVRLGRLSLDRAPAIWVQDLFQDPRIVTAPVGPEAAAWAGTLAADFPGDPIDRLLYATARDLRVPLVSKDERLRAYVGRRGDVQIVW